MTDIESRIRKALEGHQPSPSRSMHKHCTCGWFGKVLAHDFTAHQASVLDGIVQEATAGALRDAAEDLELQPPKLKAQYVSTLRLYSDEPWRLARADRITNEGT